jgi:23S rRNA (guanosine2251-2'-O)-methyltransferase
MELVVFGKRVVEYLVDRHPELVKEILIGKRISDRELKRFRRFKVRFIENREAQRLSRNGNHQGFLARIEFTPPTPPLEGNWIVVLDRVTDIGNIGSLVRTCYSLGVDLLVITGIKELKWEGIIRTSAGAGLDMPILHSPDIADILNRLKQKGYTLVGAEMGGEPARRMEKVALILGSEGEGLSGKVKRKLDKIVAVQMHRAFDSLNVAVAGAILIDRIVNGC